MSSSKTDATSIALPNILEYLKEAGKKAKDGTLQKYDAFYFNVKNFKSIKNEYGNEEAEEILMRYAKKLSHFITDGEIIGRLGGDNFVALILKGERSDIFKDMLKSTSVRICRNDIFREIEISSVAGIMEIEEGCVVDNVVSGPAVAYSYAKRMNKDAVILSDDINEDINHIKLIEKSFEEALENHEFSVYYQPKVNSLTGKIIGTEALSRWLSHGEVVSPFAFIPVLEQSGKISKLDLQVLEIVCSDIAAWVAKGHTPVPASVNFSRRDLSDEHLADKIFETIEKYGINKKDIIIEVTESASEEKHEMLSDFLTKIREYGLQTSIDDFGTGYSSLSVLREFPVNEIKIDRSFINKKLDETDEIIIQSVIDMAHKLGIEVITEGVENNEQKDFLHKLGCDRIQGFLYDKPLPKEEFEAKLLSEGYGTFEED